MAEWIYFIHAPRDDFAATLARAVRLSAASRPAAKISSENSPAPAIRATDLRLARRGGKCHPFKDTSDEHVLLRG